jgi:hypothetical protein
MKHGSAPGPAQLKKETAMEFDEKERAAFDLLVAQDFTKQPEKFAEALCALFPTVADLAPYLRLLSGVLALYERAFSRQPEYERQIAELRRWTALKPARDAAREAFRRVAGFEPTNDDLRCADYYRPRYDDDYIPEPPELE